MLYNIMWPGEKRFFIDNLEAMQVAQVGSKPWLVMYHRILTLRQQAKLEIIEKREEEVKELLIWRDKLKVLVHEVNCVLLWKCQVLPHLLDISPDEQTTTQIFYVFNHEIVAISLLDMVLVDASACEALQDCAIDLVDYCAQAVSQMIGLVILGFHEQEMDGLEDEHESIVSELEWQKRVTIYKIGLHCVSILSYLAENIAVLPISAVRRMVIKHDIPWLMSDVLRHAPWQRRTEKGIEKFMAEQWVPVNKNNAHRVVKHEEHAWLCLRQLLLHESIITSYELNQLRCVRLSSCEPLLYDTIMDQVPCLVGLQEYLSALRTAVQKSKAETTDKVIDFKQITHGLKKVFINLKKETIVELANRLSTDILANLKQNNVKDVLGETKTKLDEACRKCCNTDAKNNCSQCLKVFYCSRDCQLEDWSQHNEACKKVLEGVLDETKAEFDEVCRNCSNKDAKKRCSKCLKVFYCSLDCQMEDWGQHKKVCKAVLGETKLHLNEVCRNCCNKEAKKRCSKCLKVYYCSRDCQLEDWSQHKKTCKEAVENVPNETKFKLDNVAHKNPSA